MARIDWNHWLSLEGDAFLTVLHRMENTGVRMIHGVWAFFVEQIPEFVRHFLTWFQARCIYACRIAIRLGRVSAVFAALLILVFGPCLFGFYAVTLPWAGLAIAGSVYGLKRELKKRSTRMSA